MSSSSNVLIEIATSRHRSGILYLIETVFSKLEPIEAALDYPWDKVKAGWEKAIDQLLAHPHSHVAVDTSNNGRVVGFRLSRVIDLDSFTDPSIYEWLEPGILKDVADEMCAGWRTAFEKAKCKRMLQFACLCTTPEYGKKGLAKEMSLKNLAMAKEELGCTHCTVIATNLYSQKAFEAIGFREVRQIRYDELKDKNGEAPFVITDPMQKSVKWYMKEL